MSRADSATFHLPRKEKALPSKRGVTANLTRCSSPNPGLERKEQFLDDFSKKISKLESTLTICGVRKLEKSLHPDFTWCRVLY